MPQELGGGVALTMEQAAAESRRLWPGMGGYADKDVEGRYWVGFQVSTPAGAKRSGYYSLKGWRAAFENAARAMKRELEGGGRKVKPREPVPGELPQEVLPL